MTVHFELRRITHPDEPIAILVSSGEIDATNAEQFARLATELAAATPTVLDLADVQYIDSAGFAALDMLLAGRRMAIVVPSSSPLHAAMQIVSLAHYDSVPAARDSLKSHADQPSNGHVS